MNTRTGSPASVRSSANSFWESTSATPRRNAVRAWRVDLEPADPEAAAAPAAVGAAQERRHAAAELGIGEGLAHVVVGPALEPADAVELAVARP